MFNVPEPGRRASVNGLLIRKPDPIPRIRREQQHPKEECKACGALVGRYKPLDVLLQANFPVNLELLMSG